MGDVMAKKPARYVVCCGRCYSCILKETNSKRDASQTATSHMNAYHHDVWIRDRVEQPDTEAR